MEDVEREPGKQDRQQRHLAFAKAAAAERRCDKAHQAVLAAGQILPLDGAVLDDESKRDGDHRQIRSGHAERRQGEQSADRSRDQPGCRKGEPEADPLQSEDRGRIGANGVEADMAERDLAGESEQHVEADADDCGQGDERQNEMRVAFGDEHEGNASRGQPH